MCTMFIAGVRVFAVCRPVLCLRLWRSCLPNVIPVACNGQRAVLCSPVALAIMRFVQLMLSCGAAW